MKNEPIPSNSNKITNSLNQINTNQSNSILLSESATLMSSGINYQEDKDYSNAKLKMQQGIEKIKKVLISEGSANDKELVLEYVNKLRKTQNNYNQNFLIIFYYLV